MAHASFISIPLWKAGRWFRRCLLLGGMSCLACRPDPLPVEVDAYPIRFLEARRLSPDVVWISPLPLSGTATGWVCEAHFKPPTDEHFVDVSDPGGTRVRLRLNLARASGGRVDSSDVLSLCDIPAPWRPPSDPRIFCSYASAQEAGLVALDLEAGSQDTLLRVPRPRELDPSALWDISLSGPFFPDPTPGSPGAWLATVNYGQCRLPRELWAFDSLGARRPRFQLKLGAPLVFQGSRDLDGDGRTEWLFGSGATCDGHGAGGLADSTAYYLALRQDGTTFWLRTTPTGGGQTRMVLSPDGGLIGLRSYKNYLRGGTPHTRIQRLDPRTGAIRAEQVRGGEVVCPFGDGRLLQVDAQRGRLGWLDGEGRPLGGPVHLAGIRQVAEPAWRGPSGEPLFQVLHADGRVLQVDEGLRVRGVTQARLLWGWNEGPGTGSGHLSPMRTRDRGLCLMRPEAQPWWRWWAYRHRWGLLLVGVPLSVGLVAWAVHALRLRFLAARMARRFSETLLRRQEEERARIARELHDELGQELVLTRLGILREHVQEEGSAHPSREWIQGLDLALSSLRRIIDELRPAVLDRLGLRAALEWQLARVAQRTGLKVELVVEGDEPELPPDVETALFRIHQEALTNVVKHAGAKRVRSHLWTTGERVRIRVEDDGRGVVPARKERTAGHGWQGMRERLRPWKGRVGWLRSELGGLCVQVDLEKRHMREKDDDPRSLGG